MTKYNGHKNWNHWNVNLWLTSADEGTYRECVSACRRNRTRDKAARELLEMLPDKTPDGAPYTFSSVRAALRGIQ